MNDPGTPRWILGKSPLKMAALPMTIQILHDLYGNTQPSWMLYVLCTALGLGGSACPSDLSPELSTKVSVVRTELVQLNVEAGRGHGRNRRYLPAAVVMSTGDLGMGRWWGCPCQHRV